GDSVSRANHRTARTQLLKSEASAAAGLMNDRGIGRSLHDAGDRIRHVEHEAGRQLAIWFTRVDEAWRVRHELARIHNVAHRVVKEITLCRIGFGDGNVGNDASDDVAPFFYGIPL